MMKCESMTNSYAMRGYKRQNMSETVTEILLNVFKTNGRFLFQVYSLQSTLVEIFRAVVAAATAPVYTRHSSCHASISPRHNQRMDG